MNDLDCFLANFWRAVKFHPLTLARIADYPVSELDLHARHSWLVQQRTTIQEKIRSDEMWCDPQVAAWWVWGINQWIGSGWCPSHQKLHPHGGGDHRLFRSRPAINNAGQGIHRPSVLSRSEQLPQYLDALAKRIERVRILCGDWSRAVTPSVTVRLGLTGILLDPPYTKESGRKKNLYALDNLTVGHQVRKWAVENGGNPKLRIALCGYAEEYVMPSDWSVFEWKSQGSSNGNKERIWFSPHCLN